MCDCIGFLQIRSQMLVRSSVQDTRYEQKKEETGSKL